MKHTIINKIIKETESTSYLEIGVGDGYNFNKIEIDSKHGVEPKGSKLDDVLTMDSDKFFDGETSDYDIIFIDGHHTAEQVRKDIINSLKCNPKAIILHDTLPKSKEMQEVPRKTKQWTGDVWRAVVGFIKEYPDVKVETYRSDWGLSVIYPEGKRVRKHFENEDLTYEEFKENEVELLNIVD